MGRVIGIAVLAVSVIAGVALITTGHLGSSRLVHTVSGGTPTSHWQASVVAIDLNWWLVAPLAICLVVGLVCVVLPQRH